MEMSKTPKNLFEHESKRKKPKRETTIKMGTEGQERCYTERRKEDHGKRLSGMWEDKQM
jgi:hypothetical protein